MAILKQVRLVQFQGGRTKKYSKFVSVPGGAPQPRQQGTPDVSQTATTTWSLDANQAVGS